MAFARMCSINKAAGKHVRHNVHNTLHVKYSVAVCCLGFQPKQTLNLLFVPAEFLTLKISSE